MCISLLSRRARREVALGAPVLEDLAHGSLGRVAWLLLRGSVLGVRLGHLGQADRLAGGHDVVIAPHEEGRGCRAVAQALAQAAALEDLRARSVRAGECAGAGAGEGEGHGALKHLHDARDAKLRTPLLHDLASSIASDYAPDIYKPGLGPKLG